MAAFIHHYFAFSINSIFFFSSKRNTCIGCMSKLFLLYVFDSRKYLRRLLFVKLVFNKKKNFFFCRYGIAFSLPWLIMETLLTTPEKKRNIRSANNDLFLPYLCFVRPEISPVDCLPAAAAAPPALSGWPGLPGLPARLISLPVNSTNKTNLIPKNPFWSWSLVDLLLLPYFKDKKNEERTINCHPPHNLHNCSCRVASQLLRPRPMRHLTPKKQTTKTQAPPTTIHTSCCCWEKTITTLTHNSTSKKKNKK